MCVGSVWTHPSYIDKNPPSVFFLNPLSQIGRSHYSWLTRLSYLRPSLSELWELSANVSTPVQGKTRCLGLSDWGVLLLDVIMNIAVVIYSRHLSRWRHSGLHLFLKGMSPLIYLNASMFAQIIRDPASPTEEVSIRVFNESLHIAFPNNVIVSKFHNECG